MGCVETTLTGEWGGGHVLGPFGGVCQLGIHLSPLEGLCTKMPKMEHRAARLQPQRSSDVTWQPMGWGGWMKVGQEIFLCRVLPRQLSISVSCPLFRPCFGERRAERQLTVRRERLLSRSCSPSAWSASIPGKYFLLDRNAASSSLKSRDHPFRGGIVMQTWATASAVRCGERGADAGRWEKEWDDFAAGSTSGSGVWSRVTSRSARHVGWGITYGTYLGIPSPDLLLFCPSSHLTASLSDFL